jgi:hypothetical protein
MLTGFLKLMGVVVTMAAVFASVICLVASLMTGQVDGMVYYGLLTIFTGVCHRITVDAWL